jgi:uncharacterized protein YbjT (DUF2867 family)
MFIVTGATGAIGRAIVRQLLARVPASQIAVSVRDPEKAHDLVAAGVRVRRGDFAEPATLASAFEGAAQVLIVSVMAHGDAAVQQHRNAIDAAKAAGARRILYTSQMGANPASPFAPMPDHAATENALRASGVAFTALRNGFYASSLKMLFGRAMQTGELVAPADGPIAWTAHRDLAEVAAIAMTSRELDGVTPPLTAAEAIDLARVAEIMSEIAGREVRRRIVSDEEYRAAMIAHGAPEHAAHLMLGMFAASRLGHFAMLDGALARVIGHAPMTLREALSAS